MAWETYDEHPSGRTDTTVTEVRIRRGTQDGIKTYKRVAVEHVQAGHSDFARTIGVWPTGYREAGDPIFAVEWETTEEAS